MAINRFQLFILISLLGMSTMSVVSGCAAHPVAVKIEKTGQGYRLLRDGKPYTVKGAGMATDDLETLAKYGGNSIRTWHVEEDVSRGMAFLDRAQELGITVSLCLNIARERHGFDYDDPRAVQAQLEAARASVEAYKDHPALLTWFIGNELNYNYQNPRVYDAVNDIALMIHEVDPNHPVTTTIAGWSPELVALIEERAPALDFLSVQLYGDLINLPRYIREAGYRAPYFVTEWGAVGHWEVAKTAWGAPIEQTSSEKAQSYQKSYDQVLATDPHYAIGNYVFLWGQKQERTPTWYGLFTDTGEKTEVVDVMTSIWTGVPPENRTPAVLEFLLDNRTAHDNVYLQADKQFGAEVKMVDHDGDTLRYAWHILRESDSEAHGGDHEAVPEDLPGLIIGPQENSIRFKAPDAPGPYRLFVYAYDNKGAAAHANIPFFVNP